MSYAISDALQTAIYGALDAAGLPVFDALPSGTVPDVYMTLGPETVRDRSGVEARVAWHDLTVSVVSSEAGFRGAKHVAGNVCDTLAAADLTLDRGVLAGLVFLRAKAARTSQESVRRIDLIFRAIVEDDAQSVD
ncbi:DUF3168 domain-containing protein [Aestuariibius sp. 2305UL40-4]|uniref:DUF3168 domain-containing protein n=1 Tax=Aestuariibius violaceus TaxID=3234132 RepID=UPI00345ED371